MKRMRKIFAILMTMAMVMGLSITGFAATQDVNDITSDITVTGLSSGVATTINMYRFATLQYDSDTNEYSWNIASWAEEYVVLNDEGTAYEIATTDESALKNAAQGQTTYRTASGVSGTSYTFEDVPIGGYIIIPSDSNADYNPLFAVNTYDRENSPKDKKPAATNISVVAKSNGHTITKTLSDDFAQIGQTVTYTINATFPASRDSNGNPLNQFIITDTPTGLNISESTVKVTLAGTDITSQIDVSVNSQTGVLTVDFGNILSGGHDGKDVVITYDAVVTDVEYNNSAVAASNTTTYKPGSVDGENGSITITKVDAEDNKTALAGAEFEVYDLGVNGVWNDQNPGTPMNLIYDDELEAYRPALSTDTSSVVTVVSTTNNGVLKIVGLDEGNYHFKETKAPDGYSINNLGLTITVENAEGKIDVSDNFEDTKMAALPSTGGMGTTIFTIAGCVIMISAAGLFFASRRKAN